MSAGLKDLLDDVAAEVVTGRRIDTAAVRVGASHRRDRLRTLGTALMLTAAAVLAALVALPIFATLSVAPASGGRTGLPDRWYYAPVSAPTVKTWHMPAASMVLRGPDRTQWTLVSADTTRYARLPGRDVRLVALSDDGRKVAWVDEDGGRLTLSDLTLADGKTRSQQVVLSKGVELMALAYERNSVILSVRQGGGYYERAATFRGDRLTVGWSGAALARALGIVNSPDLRRQARVQGVGGRFYASVGGSGSTGLRKPGWPLPKEVTAVDLLAWAPGGVVMTLDYTQGQYDTRRSSVALMNPETGELHAVSRQGEGSSKPVAVARDVVGSGEAVQAAPPSFPRWNADRIRWALGSYWGNLYSGHRWTIVAGGGALATLLLLGGLRLRRRHPKVWVADGPTVRKAALRSAFALAAALLVAVALPAVYFARHETRAAAPALGRAGLPGVWFTVPSDLQPVTARPMRKASMLLTGLGGRPVLVSADGRQYASVPWRPGSAFAALSPEGTHVGWVERKSGRDVVHILRLHDGFEVTAKVPEDAGAFRQLLFGPDQAYVVTQDAVFLVDRGSGDLVDGCRCGPVHLALSSAGEVMLVDQAPKDRPSTTGNAATLRLRVASLAVGWVTPRGRPVVSPTVAVRDENTSAQIVDQDGTLVLATVREDPDDPSSWRSSSIPADPGPAPTGARVLAWLEHGPLVEVDYPGRAWLLQDNLGEGVDAWGQMGVRQGTQGQVGAVAADVVRSGMIPAPQPEFGLGYGGPSRFPVSVPVLVTGVAGVTVALLGLFAVRRRRR